MEAFHALWEIVLYILKVLGFVFSPVEALAIFLTHSGYGFWDQQKWLQPVYAAVVAADIVLCLVALKHPRLIEWPWDNFVRRGWTSVRLWCRKFGLKRVWRLPRRPNVLGVIGRLTLGNIFMLSFILYVSKGAYAAAAIQRKEHGWVGYFLAWFGGSLRVLLYPVVGYGVFLLVTIGGIVILWRMLKLPVPKPVRTFSERFSL
jgi:hypothetical protein